MDEHRYEPRPGLIECDRHGRRREDRLAQLAIVGVIVAAARLIDPRAATPGWFPGAIRVGGWILVTSEGRLWAIG